MALRVPFMSLCRPVTRGANSINSSKSCLPKGFEKRRVEHSALARLRAIRMQGSTSQTEFPNYMDGDMMLKKQAEWQRQFLKDQALVCPEPSSTQQTLRSSFIRKGVGLHSGAPVTVRVRPAFAGEGRYFVLVPEGYIKDEEETFEDDEEIDEEDLEDMRLEFYKMSLLDEEERAAREEELFPGQDLNIDKVTPAESAVKGDKGEVRIPASLDHVVSEPLKLCTKLQAGDVTISTVEHILSALEASGVDNARIEVQEGTELPVLDGSAEGWLGGVTDCGVVPAVCPKGKTRDRLAYKPSEPIVVSSGESFIMLHPEDKPRITYTIDFSAKSSAIGKQSHSWCPLEDKPYAYDIGQARTFTTLEDAEEARKAGLIRGGSPVNALIAGRADFENPPLRYSNEPVRHKMLDLIGDMALLASNGNAGLPIGHVVAFKAGHELHVKFARKVLEACSKDGPVPAVVRKQ
mmetsp:Transcript_11759/g.22429  ORF Transcript_11759/g.22429 Transcript_11759/m.22429 type:complete len:463 (+) Transcript_11759:218-1606(+)